MRTSVLALILSLHFSSLALAADEDRLSYPELEVAPRASERVRLEAVKERRGRWLVHLPVQTSALLTIVAANQAQIKEGRTQVQQEEFDTRKQRATLVGGAWFLTTAAMAALYQPYSHGHKDLKRLSVSSRRDELTRERLAEEILYRPATVAKAMKWLAVGSMTFVNLAMIEDAKENSAAIAGLAVLGSLAPLVFEHVWIANAENHKLYKKRIYGPLSGPVLLHESENQYALGYGVQFSF